MPGGQPRLQNKRAIVTGAASGIGRARCRLRLAGDEAETAGLIDRCVGDFGGLEVFYANAGVPCFSRVTRAAT